MVNTIYLLSFVETPRKFIIAIINLRGVSTKLNKYNVKTVLKMGGLIHVLKCISAKIAEKIRCINRAVYKSSFIRNKIFFKYICAQRMNPIYGC